MAPKPKLTREQVLEIRRIYSARGDRPGDEAGAGYTSLAARFGVSTSLIRRALIGAAPGCTDLPNISGTRGAAFRGQSLSGSGEDSSRAPSARQLALIPRKMTTRADKMRSVCPTCEADPGYPCVRSNGIYGTVPVKHLHPGRKAPASAPAL